MDSGRGGWWYTDEWGRDVRRELFAWSLCREVTSWICKHDYLEQFLTIAVSENHLWTFRTFCPASLPLPLPSLLFCWAPLAFSGKSACCSPEDPHLVPGTTYTAAFCLAASVWLWLWLHLQSSEDPLPLCPVKQKSEQLVCLLVFWLLVVLRMKPSSFLSSSGHHAFPVFPDRIPFVFLALTHSDISGVRCDCGSVTLPHTPAQGGRWEAVRVVFLSSLASSDSNSGVLG